MAKEVNEAEFAAVLALPGPDRYSYFIGQVADWDEVWGLRGPDGWALAADDNGLQLMPVWPHARFAEACAAGEWADSLPEAIPLDRWIEAWLTGLTRDHCGVAVFPVPGGVGVPVGAERLAADLSEALKQYE
jgi:hypothetical protein